MLEEGISRGGNHGKRTRAKIQMRHPTGGSQDTDWKKIRVLVFGLDDQFRFLARQTFRKLNLRDVTAFSEPAETAGLMGRGFDLVLVDLATKPEAGLTVIEMLRCPVGNPHDGVPILVVAPSSQKGDIDRAKALGIEGTLPKPISGHELAHRAAETLENPLRMPAPSTAPIKPKMNFIKDPAPLPDLGPRQGAEPVVMVPDAPIPEVAALAERLAVRAAGGSAAPANPDRADRVGPWSGLVKVEAPTPTPAPAPALKVVPRPVPVSSPLPPAAAPAPRPVTGGTFGGSDLTATAKRPLGGKLDMDDLVPVKPAGGKLSDADLAGTKPDLEAEAKRRAAEKRRQQWKEAMEKSGRKPRKGGDVTTLDLSAVVAEHAVWLQSNGAEGKRATFVGMDLAGADLAGALLPNATFKEVDLSDACLADARLDGSDFRYAKMEAADLGGANLGVAALRHAKLRLCNLEGAVLRGSDLSGATLTGARMAGADFKGAIMVGADLREADLSKVEGLVQAQVEKSLCDLSTRMPPGISRPAAAG